MNDSVGNILQNKFYACYDILLLLQPLRWRCVECAIHHERDVREEQHPYICTKRVIMACDLYCCLLPQCEALRTCRSGFPIATLSGTRRCTPSAALLLQLRCNWCRNLAAVNCILHWIVLTVVFEIRGWNHFAFCELFSFSKAAFVHVRPAQLCSENGVSIYMCSAVEVAWLAHHFRHSSTRVWLRLQWRLRVSSE